MSPEQSRGKPVLARGNLFWLTAIGGDLPDVHRASVTTPNWTFPPTASVWCSPAIG
jgi:hypothetical protein